jgi:hemerythrin-like metal-binding protein
MKTPSSASYVLATGHPVIDTQHEQLADLTRKLGQICVRAEQTGESCRQCPADFHLSFTNRLTDLIGDLIAFMMTHFAYEERLMRQLPATEACKQHMSSHKLAHAEISQRLSELTLKLDDEDPMACSLRLQRVITSWMGNHTEFLDADLASELAKAYETEINYDVELARLLGETSLPV